MFNAFRHSLFVQQCLAYQAVLEEIASAKNKALENQPINVDLMVEELPVIEEVTNADEVKFQAAAAAPLTNQPEIKESTSTSQQAAVVTPAQNNVAVKPTPTPEIVVPAPEPQKTTQVTSPKPSQSERLPVQRQAEQQPQLRQGHPTNGVLGERREEQREGRTVYVTPVQDVSKLFGLLKSNPQAVQEAISPPSSSATATAASYTLSRADETKIAAAATQQQRDAQSHAGNPNMVRAAYAKQLSAVCGANLNITIGTGSEAFNVKVPLPTATPKAAAMAKELRDPKLWGSGLDTSGLQKMTQEELASAAVFAAVAKKIEGKDPAAQKAELAKLEKLFAAADKNSSFVQYARQATSQLLAGLDKPRAFEATVIENNVPQAVISNVSGFGGR